MESEKDLKNCTLCCNEAKFWAVSSCNHAICLLCSARLRILCKQKECPACREIQDEVLIYKSGIKPYPSPPKLAVTRDKHGFVFSDESCRTALFDILAINCPSCKTSLSSMKSLRDHVRRAHDQHFCEICVKELKLFPFEHKVYTRQLLAEHRRNGDQDDKSHKGHPLCQFCDDRYLDKDALFFHLKEKHFWCHFCEADGKQEYYDNYLLLRKHYRKSHFLCEEGQCRHEKYTTVFRTSLDFQAHKAKVHARGLSKAEIKQLRQVEVGFSYARGTPALSYQQTRGGKGSQANHYHQREAEELEKAKAISLSEATCTTSSSINKEKKGRSRAGRKSPPCASTNSSDGSIATSAQKTAIDVSPPVDHDKKQPMQEEQRLVHVKPPPGLASVVTVEPFKQEAWPILDSIAAKKPRSTGPPPGFHNLAPKSMHSTWSVLPSSVTIPPGFLVAGEFPTLQNNASAASSNKTGVAASPLMLDADVIKVAESILNNNPSKVSQFRLLSGKYQSGAVSVDEYYSKCEHLFGSIWKELGPRLATTIPDKKKQDMLLKKFGLAFIVEEPLPWNSGTATPIKKQAVNNRVQASWLYGGHFEQDMHPLMDHSYLNKLSEEEYPSLGSKMGVPTHSNTATWSCKVSVK